MYHVNESPCAAFLSPSALPEFEFFLAIMIIVYLQKSSASFILSRTSSKNSFGSLGSLDSSAS